jgi:hypothetical protein
MTLRCATAMERAVVSKVLFSSGVRTSFSAVLGGGRQDSSQVAHGLLYR